MQHLSDYSILTLKTLDRLVLPGTLPTARLDFVIVITWFGILFYFSWFDFIAATKINFGKKLLKIIFQTYFLWTKRCYKGLKGASAKISVLKILSGYFRCQVVTPLFVKYTINFLRISFVLIAALLPHFKFWRISPNMVYPLEDSGNRTIIVPWIYFIGYASVSQKTNN